jgi:hypothetical protein
MVLAACRQGNVREAGGGGGGGGGGEGGGGGGGGGDGGGWRRGGRGAEAGGRGEALAEGCVWQADNCCARLMGWWMNASRGCGAGVGRWRAAAWPAASGGRCMRVAGNAVGGARYPRQQHCMAGRLGQEIAQLLRTNCLLMPRRSSDCVAGRPATGPVSRLT